MNSRTVVLISAALIAAFTAVVVRNRLSSKPKVAVAITESKRVLIAKRDLAPGVFIDANNDLDWAEVKGVAENESLREGVVKRTDYNGAVMRRAVKTGKAIAPDEITRSGDGGFLSAVLEPGMRAVSIAVNATTGAAGFIAPGDRVDLIITHRVNNSGRQNVSESQETVVSETFVQRVRVVAVDQSLDSADAKATLAKNVTVEVNEQQAEQIAVATEMGKISMALRSALPETEANKAATSSNYTRDSDVSQMMVRDIAIAPRVRVIRGDAKEELQFMQPGAQ